MTLVRKYLQEALDFKLGFDPNKKQRNPDAYKRGDPVMVGYQLARIHKLGGSDGNLTHVQLTHNQTGKVITHPDGKPMWIDAKHVRKVVKV